MRSTSFKLLQPRRDEQKNILMSGWEASSIREETFHQETLTSSLTVVLFEARGHRFVCPWNPWTYKCFWNSTLKSCISREFQQVSQHSSCPHVPVRQSLWTLMNCGNLWTLKACYSMIHHDVAKMLRCMHAELQAPTEKGVFQVYHVHLLD